MFQALNINSGWPLREKAGENIFDEKVTNWSLEKNSILSQGKVRENENKKEWRPCKYFQL